ncbi:MAG: Asp-tRNA(Asn)/Glu-tRNA(Gln) amidotransferase subunit GatB [Nanoarchaeota archaeon]
MKAVSILEGMIGLEIHVYLVTKEKLFCTCIASREKGLQSNIYVCPICTGQPGAKPMLPNKSAVEKAVQIGLMLGCTINTHLMWQRKHYNWPDLPKGYQNTLSGAFAVPVGVKGKFHGINISSMHLEEDPASWDPESGCIDYNRSGLPLVEIITSPDFSTSEEVVDWLKKLLHALAYLKAADTNAGIKVDVNVSVPGKSERVEIKNISSLESIAAAIEYELERQKREGGKEQETRRFDAASGKTMKMRSKEDSEDYRFLSDPDLQDLVFSKEMVEDIRKKLPEAPEVKLEKLVKRYKIDSGNAEILAKHIDIVEFFERIAEKIDGKFALPWITVELLRFLHYRSTTLDKVEILPEHFIALLELVKEGKITPLKGKEILNQFYPKSFMPSAGEGKITDVKELEKVAREVVGKNAQAASDYKKGEKKSFEFLMGEIMKATQKRADFKIAREVLQKVLS